MKIRTPCLLSGLGAVAFSAIVVTQFPDAAAPSALLQAWLLWLAALLGALLSTRMALSYAALLRARHGHSGSLVRLARRFGTKRVRLALAGGALGAISALGPLGPLGGNIAYADAISPMPYCQVEVPRAAVSNGDDAVIDLGWGGRIDHIPAQDSPQPATSSIGWQESTSSAQSRAEVARAAEAGGPGVAGGPEAAGAAGTAEATAPETADTAKAANAKDPAISAAPANREVTVRVGDTLWDIAARTLPGPATDAQIMQQVNAIVAENAIGNPNLIYPGQLLTLGTTQ